MSTDIFQQITPYEKDSCVFDALSIALEKSQEEIIKDLKTYGDNPKKETQWGQYLIDNGYHKIEIKPTPNKPRILLSKLTKIALPNQILICKATNHIVTIKNRKFYDSVDSSKLCIFWYYTK